MVWLFLFRQKAKIERHTGTLCWLVLVYGFASVGAIIHSIKLVYCLPVQTRNSFYLFDTFNIKPPLLQ